MKFEVEFPIEIPVEFAAVAVRRTYEDPLYGVSLRKVLSSHLAMR